jgi:hypothetical protein
LPPIATDGQPQAARGQIRLVADKPSSRHSSSKRLLYAFLAAARAGEFGALEELFTRGRRQSV